MSAGDAAFLGQVWCLNTAPSSALYQHFCPSLLSMSCLDRLGKKIVSSKHKRMKKKIFGNHCYSVSMVKFSWLLFEAGGLDLLESSEWETRVKEGWKMGMRNLQRTSVLLSYTALLTEQKSGDTGWPFHLSHWWQCWSCCSSLSAGILLVLGFMCEFGFTWAPA